MPGDLLTAAAIAAEVGIPESTARYYLRKYAAWVPTVGTGRQRRYRREAVAVLRFVADQHKAGLSADLVEASLASRFPINAQPQQPTVTTQQQTVTTAEDARALFDALVRQAVRDEVSGLMAEVTTLREEVQRLTAALAAQQGQQEPQPTATAGQPTAAPPEPVELPPPTQPTAAPQPTATQASEPVPARPWWKFWERPSP